MHLRIISLVFAVQCSILAPVQAANCQLQNLAVTPLQPGHYEVFHATGKSVELRFNSVSNDAHVDAFPEPPLQILQRASNTQCEINAGIWVRKDVYLSRDEQLLLTHEYSGSNDFLVFYSTRDCSKLHELDVSVSTWKISGNLIRTEKQDGKRRSRQDYALNASCLPQTMRK
ncbi:hypothetical protein ACO0LF_06670 [Undibacterium sp. Di27W]|uniref:hypothetical protein n=1 Tax=Undibacterium sp. Di27W TaxID=3413036 RepID=UPI003BF098D2